MIVRFVGDPVGYRVHINDAPKDGHLIKPIHLVNAQVGNTEKQVVVNLGQAYLFEPEDNEVLA